MKKIKEFFKNVRKELKRVRWPKKADMIKYSVATLACIVLLSLFFTLSDLIIAGAKSLLDSIIGG